MENHPAEHDKPWHPEDLCWNLMVMMPPLALGLARGRQYVKLDDTFWPKTGDEA
jgi:hypothetical protein